MQAYLKRTHFVNKPFPWFIILCIYLAYLYPEIGAKDGPLKPGITVKYIAVGIIFFISGLSLKTEELTGATYQYRIHFVIQLYSFIFTPLMTQMFVQLIGQFYPNPDLLIGFVTVSCMPPPVSSAVLLTRAVGGNEAAAVFNSALGSFLGIFASPALLYLFFGGSGEVPIWSAIIQLGLTVVLPVFIGQFARNVIHSNLLRQKKKLSATSSFMLLLIIYTAFCETFSKHESVLTTSLVLVTLFTVFFLHSISLGVCFFTTSNLTAYFSREDIITMMYCSTHKSLTLGFPLLKILYGSESNFILISFPLLLYHPMQILIGSILVPFMQKWIKSAKNKTKSYLV